MSCETPVSILNVSCDHGSARGGRSAHDHGCMDAEDHAHSDGGYMAGWVVLRWGQGHAWQRAEGSSCAGRGQNVTLSRRRRALKVVGFGEENGAARERLWAVLDYSWMCEQRTASAASRGCSSSITERRRRTWTAATALCYASGKVMSRLEKPS